MTVIELKDTSQWYDANLLKRSIEWMKQHNQTGRFSKAIEDEEKMLDMFFRQFHKAETAKGTPPALSSAA